VIGRHRRADGVVTVRAEQLGARLAPAAVRYANQEYSGYTLIMKTAVSIPDEIFEEAERLAERLRTSRSRLYSRALGEFVRHHSPEHVTEAMNRVVDQVGREPDEFSRAAARGVLRKVEW